MDVPALSAIEYTQADYLAALQDHMPRGAIWPRDADAVQTQVLGAVAYSYLRSGARAVGLLSDAFPVAPVELLPEWEASLGLPDPCAGIAPSLQARQQAVAARFVATGGQNAAYFVAVAAALGYQITITQFAPSRFGQAFGMLFGGSAWAYTWQVNAPEYSVQPLQFGGDFGDYFSQWGNTVLQCELQRLAPAHTTLIFNYS
jgi:uncharacterized protein YmfQ (DUF2313 family)